MKTISGEFIIIYRYSFLLTLFFEVVFCYFKNYFMIKKKSKFREKKLLILSFFAIINNNKV